MQSPLGAPMGVSMPISYMICKQKYSSPWGQLYKPGKPGKPCKPLAAVWALYCATGCSSESLMPFPCDVCCQLALGWPFKTNSGTQTFGSCGGASHVWTHAYIILYLSNSCTVSVCLDWSFWTYMNPNRSFVYILHIPPYVYTYICSYAFTSVIKLYV